MRKQTILSILMGTFFLTAQAAVDAGRTAPNQMPVLPNTQVYVPNSFDLQLRDRVQQQLRSSVRNYDPNRITILSQNGEITLKGIVKSREEADQLERETLRVTGVSRVKNNVVLSLDSTQ